MLEGRTLLFAQQRWVVLVEQVVSRSRWDEKRASLHGIERKTGRNKARQDEGQVLALRVTGLAAKCFGQCTTRRYRV
jgi:hypothetical protein